MIENFNGPLMSWSSASLATRSVISLVTRNSGQGQRGPAPKPFTLNPAAPDPVLLSKHMALELQWPHRYASGQEARGVREGVGRAVHAGWAARCPAHWVG